MGNLAYLNKELIDTATGEIVTAKQITLECLKEMYNQQEKIKEQQREYIKLQKSKENLHKIIDKECGSFYFSFCDKIIQCEYLFRFIYLCTYMNYNNILVFGKSKDMEKRKATKKDLKEIMKLKDQQHYDTINYFIKNEFIKINDSGIHINKSICIRGEIGDSYKEKGVLVRMFDTAIQEIYNNSNTKEHKKIGLLVKLLPYVNKETNIICKNPEETEIGLIKPLKQQEILEILNITKPTTLSLVNIKILNGKEGAFIKASNAFVKNFYVINPRFLTRINNIEALNKTLDLFRIGNI